MELVRASFNISKKLANKVDEYAKEMGLNKTSAYIVLLNQALTQIELHKNVPELVNTTKDLEKIAVLIHNNKQQ